MIQTLLDMFTGTDVVGRQQRQWQLACKSLAAAEKAVNDGRYEEAQAHALTGLLAEKLASQ